MAWVKEVIDELRYEGVEIGMKMDGARELLQLRREVAALRSAPTVPVDVMQKESKKNDTVSLVKAPTAASKRNGPLTKLSKKQPPPILDGSLGDEDLDLDIETDL